MQWGSGDVQSLVMGTPVSYVMLNEVHQSGQTENRRVLRAAR